MRSASHGRAEAAGTVRPPRDLRLCRHFFAICGTHRPKRTRPPLSPGCSAVVLSSRASAIADIDRRQGAYYDGTGHEPTGRTAQTHATGHATDTRLCSPHPLSALTREPGRVAAHQTDGRQRGRSQRGRRGRIHRRGRRSEAPAVRRGRGSLGRCAAARHRRLPCSPTSGGSAPRTWSAPPSRRWRRPRASA